MQDPILIFMSDNGQEKKKITICLYGCVQKVEKKKNIVIFRHLQCSTDAKGKIIIVDVILHSGMESGIHRQYVYTHSFLIPDKKKWKSTISLSRLLHGFRNKMHDPPDKHVPFLLQSNIPTFILGIGCATLQ